METVCELCNALKTVSPQCACGTTMLDSGPVSDYSGPYSPYFNMSFEGNYCHHLFACPACGKDIVYSMPLRKK